MRAVLRSDLQAGTFGMSTGLEYVPGIYSEPTEFIALAEEVGMTDGVIMSHMRTQDDATSTHPSKSSPRRVRTHACTSPT